MASTAYQINVHDLMHKPGQMRELELDVNVPEALGEGIIQVRSGANLELDLRLESVHEGILATGEVFVRSEGECSRCLDPISSALEVDFQELFAYSVSDEDDFAVIDEKIDLEQAIRDAVVLSLPYHPLCSADCAGLCPECGVKLAENPQHEHETATNSRWAALESFSKKEE
jgi:uncharacterized protein